MVQEYKLSDTQLQRSTKWISLQEKSKGYGHPGRFSVIFTDTPIGINVMLLDNANNEILDLTEYENW